MTDPLPHWCPSVPGAANRAGIKADTEQLSEARARVAFLESRIAIREHLERYGKLPDSLR